VFSINSSWIMYKNLKKIAIVDWVCILKGYWYKISCPSWVSNRVFLFLVYKELMLKVNYVGTFPQSPSMSTNNPLDIINTTRLLKTKKNNYGYPRIRILRIYGQYRGIPLYRRELMTEADGCHNFRKKNTFFAIF